jgi:hypothetical protein
MMNLSQRLDQARAKRQAGEVPDAGPTPFDLRMAKEQPVYDGRHLRSGEELTQEAWQRLKTVDDDGAGLPTWNPKRANEEVLGAWAAEVPFDLTPPFVSPPPPPATPGAEGAPGASRDRDANVIDLRSRTATPATDGFSLPPWATGSPHPSVPPAAPSAPNLFAQPTAARPGVAPTCPECGAEAELVRLDLLTDRADLACSACTHHWTEAAAHLTHPG